MVSPVWSSSGGIYVISQLNDEFHNCPRKRSIGNKQTYLERSYPSHKRPTEISQMGSQEPSPSPILQGSCRTYTILGKQIFPSCNYCLCYSSTVAPNFVILFSPFTMALEVWDVLNQFHFTQS